MRIVISQQHLIKDNPGLMKMDEMDSRDRENFELVYAIRTGSTNKTLLLSSEGRKMEERVE